MPAPHGPLAPIGYVAVGGALGAVARWAISTFIASRWSSWPYGTLIINLTGCFIIGLTLTLLGSHSEWPEYLRWLVPIGFIGGFTTFSSYEYETWRLVESGRLLAAFAYVAISTVVGFGAVALGAICGKKFG